MSWNAAYLETRIVSASPLQLVSILYEFGIVRVQEARMALSARDVTARVRALSKAFGILGELECSLNLDAGGIMAANLSRLYRYMRNRLTEANMCQSDEMFAEVEALLKTLGEAWDRISASRDPQGTESPDVAWLAAQAADIFDSPVQQWTF